VENAAMPSNSQPPRQVIGVDVGGTKVAAGIVDGASVDARVEHATDVSGPEQLLAGIEAVVAEVVAAVGPPAGVGVGLPSQIDFATGTVVASANIPLAGIDVRDQMSERLGCPVYVDNDGNCAALAESQSAGAGHLVMLTLGTGVGGGVIIDGRIFRGASGLGGELGHVVLDPDGPECPGACPSRGCIESFCSGTALGHAAEQLAEARPDSPLGRTLAAEGHVAGPHVVELARDGDPDALQLLDRLGRMLGVALASMINAFEPGLLVIGGGLSRAGDLFMETAEREARARALPALSERVTLALARAGADAGVIGAGCLAAQELGFGADRTGDGGRR
jgi:glucokinase